ncbi:MAG: transglycosylase SLT domain-containing protein, partial [Gammaproteobacteria bacterium]|nr:transglycosylase SLT domain-containing protein [Gammaproteobacteria bacterium]
MKSTTAFYSRDCLSGPRTPRDLPAESRRRCRSTAPGVALALALGSLVATPALATGGESLALLSPINSTSSSQSDDQSFLEAEKAIKQGQRGRFLELAESLTEHPLYPYLLYEDLSRRLSRAKAHEVEAFLESYRDLPLTPRLKRRWLKRLAKTGRWSDFLKLYEPTGDVALHCHHLRAQILSGDREAAYARVADLWLHGESRPEPCDPVFESWIEAGHLSQELVWERIWLAMQNHRTGLAKYLSRYLPEDQRPLLDDWIALRSSPKRIKRFSGKADETLSARMRVYAVERLARSDPDAAAALWNYLSAKYDFDEALARRIYRRVGLAYAREGRAEAGEWLKRTQSESEYLRHWRLANAVLHGRWREALEVMPDPEADGRNADRWRYWRARSLQALGYTQVAESLYRSLASERSYYGFLAADAIGASYQFQDDPLIFDDEALQRLASAPPGRRIRALLALGRMLDARREWYYWIPNMDVVERAQAAKLAQRWNWYDVGILTVARTPYRDDLGLRFPLAHEEEVARNASHHGLEPAMVLAMIRQESAFKTDAASPKGARGLMQLMPSTGRRVARSVGVRLKRRNELFDPALNVKLGTAYFRRLLDRTRGNHVLALGAYNAGPQRVKAWRPQSGSVSADVWIENIAYTETREYVKSVLAYTVV